MAGMKDAYFGDKPASYPIGAGYKEHTTSKEAARKITAGSALGRAEILGLIAQAPNGLTADEVATSMGRDKLYVRPRLSELRELGLIEPTDQRRINASGMSARVWRAKGPTNGIR